MRTLAVHYYVHEQTVTCLAIKPLVIYFTL